MAVAHHALLHKNDADIQRTMWKHMKIIMWILFHSWKISNEWKRKEKKTVRKNRTRTIWINAIRQCSICARDHQHFDCWIAPLLLLGVSNRNLRYICASFCMYVWVNFVCSSMCNFVPMPAQFGCVSIHDSLEFPFIHLSLARVFFRLSVSMYLIHWMFFNPSLVLFSTLIIAYNAFVFHHLFSLSGVIVICPYISVCARALVNTRHIRIVVLYTQIHTHTYTYTYALYALFYTIGQIKCNRALYSVPPIVIRSLVMCSVFQCQKTHWNTPNTQKHIHGFIAHTFRCVCDWALLWMCVYFLVYNSYACRNAITMANSQCLHHSLFVFLLFSLAKHFFLL